MSIEKVMLLKLELGFIFKRWIFSLRISAGSYMYTDLNLRNYQFKGVELFLI